jgi:hypothetical protein
MRRGLGAAAASWPDAASITPATPLSNSTQVEASGERRYLTVMFCDLVDSTGIAARLVQSSNENPPFEQIGKPQWDQSGVFRIRYGSGLDDPMPFVLTVTLPYVAREPGKSVSFAEISKYVEQNADNLKAKARFAKMGRGFTTHTLE